MNVKNYVYNNIPMVEVTNTRGLRVTFSSLGASIYSIYLDNVIMSMTPKSFEDFFRKEIYYGKTIGPIAGRVKEGKVVINNETYQMEVNENGNALHGGNYCLSNFNFYPSFMTTNNSVSITYTFKKPHMKDGLPGNITYNIIYRMNDDTNDISVFYKVNTDMTTPISLTNHTFFTLGDSSIDNLYLTIKSHRFIEVDKDNLLPIKYLDLIPCMDFNESKKLIKDIRDPYLLSGVYKGYDHYIEVDYPKITLENDRYILEIIHDFRGVIVYSDNYIDDVPTINSKQRYHRGVALEPEDSPFDSHILNKDDTYEHKIVYIINKK